MRPLRCAGALTDRTSWGTPPAAPARTLISAFELEDGEDEFLHLLLLVPFDWQRRELKGDE